MVQNRQKVKVGEIWPCLRLFSNSIFWINIRPMKLRRSYKRFLRPKEAFLRGWVIRPANTGIWLFGRANRLHAFSLYVERSSNQAKNAF